MPESTHAVVAPVSREPAGTSSEPAAPAQAALAPAVPASGVAATAIPARARVTLRDYQRECIDVIAGLAGGSHLVQMATGLGKTVTFANIPRRGRMLVLSHRDELVYQPVRYFDCPVGIEKAGERSAGEEVVSASVQTLSRGSRLSERFRPGEFDVIVTDEAHHALAPSYRKIYDYLRPRLHVGFTATPRRGDDRGLSDVFEDIVFTRDLRWGIEHGYLTDIDCRRVTVEWDTRAVRKKLGDFVPGALDEAVNRPATNEQVAQAYAELHVGQTLVFATSVAHAHALAALIPGSVVVDGTTPLSERRAIIAAFTRREFPCLLNYGVFTEGTDLPLIETVLLARPTKNPALYTQMVGRGLRLFSDPASGYVKQSLRLIDCMGAGDDLSVCTPPTLLGMNERDFSQLARGVVQGSLLHLEERIADVEDSPAGWVLRSREVDLLDSKSGLAWVMHANGDRRLSGTGWSVTMRRPDLLGGVAVEFRGAQASVRVFRSVREAERRVAKWLAANPLTKGEQQFWSAEAVEEWAHKPATPKQLEHIRRLLGERTGDLRLGELSRRDAQVVIQNAAQKREDADAERYGRCPVCGRALRPSASGRSLTCVSNRWERDGDGWRRVAGCGYQRPA